MCLKKKDINSSNSYWKSQFRCAFCDQFPTQESFINRAYVHDQRNTDDLWNIIFKQWNDICSLYKHWLILLWSTTERNITANLFPTQSIWTSKRKPCSVIVEIRIWLTKRFYVLRNKLLSRYKRHHRSISTPNMLLTCNRLGWCTNEYWVRQSDLFGNQLQMKLEQLGVKRGHSNDTKTKS